MNGISFAIGSFVLFKTEYKKPSVIPVRSKQCSRTTALFPPRQSNALFHNPTAKIGFQQTLLNFENGRTQ